MRLGPDVQLLAGDRGRRHAAVIELVASEDLRLLPGIGQTIQLTAAGVHLPAAAPVTAVAIPYFQWDNRDGGGMRVWMPEA